MTEKQGLRALTADELDLIAGGAARTGGCIPPKRPGPKGPTWPFPPTGPIDPITGTGPYMPY